MDVAGAQTLPAIVSTLDPSESLAKRDPGESSAGAETPLAIALRPSHSGKTRTANLLIS
jgi:hypothetical protein